MTIIEHPDLWARLEKHCRSRRGPWIGRFQPTTCSVPEDSSHEGSRIWWRFEEQFRERFPEFHEGVRQGLPEDAREEWTAQREFHQELFGAVFSGVGRLGCIAVIEGRHPFKSRFCPSTADVSIAYDQARAGWLDLEDMRGGAKWVDVQRNKLVLGHGIGEVRTKKLVFVEDGLMREVRVYKRLRLRGIKGERFGPLHARDTVYFLSHPDRFSVECSSWDHVPIMQEYVRLGLYTSTTVTLAVIGEKMTSLVQLLITLDSDSGRTVVLAAGRRPPEMFFRHYPQEEVLTARAADLPRVGYG